MKLHSKFHEAMTHACLNKWDKMLLATINVEKETKAPAILIRKGKGGINLLSNKIFFLANT